MVLLSRPVTGPRILQRLAPGMKAPTYTRFRIVPQAATLGGLVEGVDLAEPCDDELLAELRAALCEWKVLFFEDQVLTREQQGRFAMRWGRMVNDMIEEQISPNPLDDVVEFARDAQTTGIENNFHSDGTFRPMPPAVTFLRALEVPPVGGDTVFADMAAAFDNLPEDLQARVLGLHAVHDWSIGAYAAKYEHDLERLRKVTPPVVHPVVIKHPDTGRATLFVNAQFTDRLVEIEGSEGEELLDAMFRITTLPELQVRCRWRPGTVAVWDNLACQHYGVNDYYPNRRVMCRASVYSTVHSRLEAAA